MSFPRRAVAALACVTTVLAAAACGAGGGSGHHGRTGNVEVLTWWTESGDRAGLDGLVRTFARSCPGYTFVNGAVAGGAGTNAKQQLATRFQQNNPPDTFQSHTGAELAAYVRAGQVEDLSADFRSWGLAEVVPKGLLDSVTVDGRIYAVPANIHRANMLWSNKKVLASAGITADATTLDQFISDLETLKGSGVAAPLAMGRDWTQLMLLEAVLITDLGPQAFTGLWTGGTSWTSAAVTKAIIDYRTLLRYSNQDRDSLEWTDAEKLVTTGKSGYQLMGDWEAADLDAQGFKDYGYVVFPGNSTTFQWLADSFVLPKGAKNPTGTRCWLRTVGSAQGQQAFNSRKGSIPARTDAVESDYPAYQQSAITSWKKATQVPSCAHGAACTQALQDALNAATVTFSTDQNVQAFQQALTAAAARFSTR